jgi:hypothetical protein
MFERWTEYFFMIGSSAAALIGLMFVVVTLTSGRGRDQTEDGKHFYTSPVVWNLSVVLFISGAAIAPTVKPLFFSALVASVALVGLFLGIRSTIGIKRTQISGHKFTTFDMWWYGIIPALTYVGLAACAAGIETGQSWAASAVAANLMALLLVSIHAEWDLATFLAPLGSSADQKND